VRSCALVIPLIGQLTSDRVATDPSGDATFSRAGAANSSEFQKLVDSIDVTGVKMSKSNDILSVEIYTKAVPP
jgi:hypothetical protein